MPSTYSPDLRFELIATGEQDGTWGITTDTNIGSLIEQAIAGITTIDVTSSDVTLTALNGAVDQARSAALLITGTPGVSRTVTIPNVPKLYQVYNGSNAVVVISTGSGTTFTCASGYISFVYSTGSNVVAGVTPPPVVAGQIQGNLTGNVTGNVTGSVTGSATAITDGTNQTFYSSGALFSRATGNMYFQNQAGSANYFYCDTSGNLTATGNVTAYSDARLKTDVKTITYALDKVDKLRGVTFIKDGQEGLGVIAQEVRAVFPELVQVNEHDGMLSVAYGNMVGVLIEAVKELRAEVKKLKGE